MFSFLKTLSVIRENGIRTKAFRWARQSIPFSVCRARTMRLVPTSRPNRESDFFSESGMCFSSDLSLHRGSSTHSRDHRGIPLPKSLLVAGHWQVASLSRLLDLLLGQRDRLAKTRAAQIHIGRIGFKAE